MKLISLILLSLFLFTSCGSSKRVSSSSARKSGSIYKTKNKSHSKADAIVRRASSYIGTRYKYGGTTKKGMDCSGLVYTSFAQENIVLPRMSSAMSTKGKPVAKNKAQKGDLVFFKTSKSRSKITHVGVISRIDNSAIYFVHSSTSKGVIESNSNESYWNKAFRFIKRVL